MILVLTERKVRPDKRKKPERRSVCAVCAATYEVHELHHAACQRELKQHRWTQDVPQRTNTATTQKPAAASNASSALH